MHQIYLSRRKPKPHSRISTEQWNIVEDSIRQDFSPEQTSLHLAYEGRVKVSHEWIYQYIASDKRNNGDLHSYLRCKKKP